MASSLRLLFVVPFSPRTDVMHGGRVVSQLLGRLVERNRVAVAYVRAPGSDPIDPDLAARCDVVEEVEVASADPEAADWRRRLHVLAAPLSGVPSQVASLRDRRFARVCSELARSWQPDVIQVEHDQLAYCGRLMSRQSHAVRVLISHDPGVPASKDQALASAGRQRLAHRIDAATWKRYWSRTLPAFDSIVTFTDQDGDVMAAAAPRAKVVTIGLGIDIPPAPLSSTGHGEPCVVFVGGYRHPPNADAALRLIQSIMPLTRRRLPGLRLVLAGTDPGPKLLEAATEDDTVTGTVPSMTPFLDAAAVVALPLRLGGGMRVKLLEALAAGKAVVASSVAAAGLAVVDGEQLVLADTDEEFAQAIARLVRDTEARTRLGHNAREWAMRNLTWDARVREYEELYRSLLASQVP